MAIDTQGDDLLAPIRSVALAFLLVGASTAILSSGSDGLECRVNGYERHFASFKEPGLFAAMIQAIEDDDRIELRDNAAYGLPLDDEPRTAHEWDEYALMRLVWHDPHVAAETPGIHTVAVDGSRSVPSVVIEASQPPVTHEDQVLFMATLSHVFGRVMDVDPQVWRDLADATIQQLAQDDFEHGPMAVLALDSEWLALGRLYDDMDGENMVVKRNPATGMIEASRTFYTFHFSALHTASLKEVLDGHRYVMVVHSDDHVEIGRNLGPLQDGDLKKTDEAFTARMETMVQEFSMEPPSLQGLKIWDTCGSTCTRCGLIINFD